MVQHYKGTLAAVQLDYGEIKEAIANLTEAVTQDVGAAKLSLTYRASQATAQGRARLIARRASEAIGFYEAALALFGEASTRSTLVLSAEAEHALALAQTGRVDEASERLDRIVAERRRDNNTGELQVALRYLAYVRSLQSRHAEALSLLREAIQILQIITAAPTARSTHKLALADATRDAGLALIETGAVAHALRHLDDARERYATLQGRVSPNRADALIGSGRARLQLGRAAEAVVLFEQADAFWRDFDPDNRWAGEAAYWHARGLTAVGRSGEARMHYTRAARLLARSAFPGDAQLARAAASAMRTAR
jgi:tetratricopeptide (TPR) repeat protein